MMRKRIGLWITVVTIGLAGATGCASRNASAPAPAEAPAPPLAATPPRTAYQGGFQGIGCGSPPSSDMKLVRTEGDIKFYTRQGEPLGVGRAQLKQPTLYRFYKDQFEGALLETSGAQNDLAMLGYFQSIIGAGKVDDPATNRHVWADSSLVVIYEQPASAPQNASIVVGCRGVQLKHQADILAAQGQQPR
jgi:hypothetical protein